LVYLRGMETSPGGRRGARFTVLEDVKAYEDGKDWIVLDIPPDQLKAVLDKIQDHVLAIEEMAKQGRPTLPNTFCCVHLRVEPHHPKTVGAKKPDGASPDVDYPPSLLRDDIPLD
jgi:hypothetical protein